MSRSATIGLVLVGLGAIASAPGVILVGSLTILTSWLTALVASRAAQRHLRRRLPRDPRLPGDRVELRLTVHNNKLLPSRGSRPKTS